MSKVTKIHTCKNIDLFHVCGLLVDEDAYKIEVINLDDDFISYFIPGVSIRCNEITKTSYGYEVSIAPLACEEDIRLYRDTIKHLILNTGGKVKYQSKKLHDPIEFFNDNFIRKAVNDEFNKTMALAKHHLLSIFCPRRPFCIGKNMYNKIIESHSDENLQRLLLYRLIRASQYIIDGENSMRMRINQSANHKDKDKPERISCYNKNEYRYVLCEKYFGLYDSESCDAVIIEYENIKHIIPDSWTLFDECQYITTDISDDEWKIMFDKALEYKL
jgi:hypothetical protein